jgi:Cof subfamily protein (haloacid dehalogenase superfamily)
MNISPTALCVSDLDGTLLRSDGTISSAARDIINRLVSNGLRFTVATARSPARTLSVLRGLRMQLPLICLNGAVTVDPVTGRWLSMAAVDAASVDELIATGARNGLAPFLIGEHDGRETLMHLRPHGRVQQEFIGLRMGEPRLRRVDVLRPLDQTLSVTFVDEFERLAAFGEALIEGARDRLVVRLMDYPDIEGGATLEVSRQGVDKAACVRDLATSLGLHADEVVVFGDHINDLPMLAWAGTAVAVGNAKSEVLAAADFRCESNDADGVAKFLNRLRH